jgi:hypothetical protein
LESNDIYAIEEEEDEDDSFEKERNTQKIKKE